MSENVAPLQYESLQEYAEASLNLHRAVVPGVSEAVQFLQMDKRIPPAPSSRSLVRLDEVATTCTTDFDGFKEIRIAVPAALVCYGKILVTN
jgi:hypothetical protein